MLRQRVITAVWLLAVLLPTLWVDSAQPFAAFALVLAAAGAWEWGRLCGLQGTASWLYAAVPAGAMAVGTVGSALQAPAALWWALTAAWVAASLALMPRGPEGWKSLPPLPRLLMGWVAMFSTWLALSGARLEGVNFLLSVMCIVWVSDISAYFAGRRWGRHRLAPTLSPGKTWEGVIGACVGVLLLSLAWMAVEGGSELGAPSVFARARDALGLVGLAAAVAALVALGVVGDLFESMIKRAAGVKDSSGLLPGHGGVLDRVDALLPVMPAAMAVLALGTR